MTVLVITHSQDSASIPTVMDMLRDAGETVFRLDTDQFPTDVQLDIYYRNGTEQIIITSEQGSFTLNEVSAVWNRQLRVGEALPTTLDSQIRNVSLKESQRTILGMTASLRCFQLDPLVNIYRAERKQLQLQVAQQLGLEIPQTLITNCPAAVKEFAETCENGLVVKMQSGFSVQRDGQEKVMFTNPVTPNDLEHLDGLSLCPMMFQEQILKALELRVVIVGKELFTAAIASQKFEQSRYDWRRQVLSLVDDWQPYSLPQEVEAKLLSMMNYFGLNYGAIDLILTPDNRYVFLEINPCGEFSWLDNMVGLPISQAIANLLLHQTHNTVSENRSEQKARLITI